MKGYIKTCIADDIGRMGCYYKSHQTGDDKVRVSYERVAKRYDLEYHMCRKKGTASTQRQSDNDAFALRILRKWRFISCITLKNSITNT